MAGRAAASKWPCCRDRGRKRVARSDYQGHCLCFIRPLSACTNENRVALNFQDVRACIDTYTPSSLLFVFDAPPATQQRNRQSRADLSEEFETSLCRSWKRRRDLEPTVAVSRRLPPAALLFAPVRAKPPSAPRCSFSTTIVACSICECFCVRSATMVRSFSAVEIFLR